jgi:hypothetical protein
MMHLLRGAFAACSSFWFGFLVASATLLRAQGPAQIPNECCPPLSQNFSLFDPGWLNDEGAPGFPGPRSRHLQLVSDYVILMLRSIKSMIEREFLEADPVDVRAP